MRRLRRLAAFALVATLAAACTDDSPQVESTSTDSEICEVSSAVVNAVSALISGVDEQRFTYDVGYEADAGTVLRVLRLPAVGLNHEWRSAFDQVWMHFERYWSTAVPQGVDHEHQSIVRNLRAADSDHRLALIQATDELHAACSTSAPAIASRSACDERGPGADLIGCDLGGLDLSHLDLSGSLLQLADLTDADLTGTNLAGADLAAASLTGVTINGARLDRTNLRFTDLAGVDLGGASFIGATFLTTNLPTDLSNIALDEARFGVRKLISADFRGSTMAAAEFTHDDLSGSNFDGTDLTDALMVDTKLVGASLIGATATGARLAGADLSNASATGIDLTNANLAGTHLRGTSLRDATFVDAVLDHADFTGADLQGVDFTGAHWNTTTCPDGSISDDHPAEACPTGS